MIDILLKNPILVLFLVAAIGYPLGRIKVGGTSLGVASVLFVGLAVGALHPDLKLPDIIFLLGQVLFLYTIGLASGSVFFASLKQNGLRNATLALGMIAMAAILSALAGNLFHFKPTFTSGLFAGALTNTPALAAVLNYLQAATPASLVDQVRSEPVVAYSLTYPIGVLGMILAIVLMQRIWKVDYAQEAPHLKGLGGGNEPLHNLTIRITNPQYVGIPIRDLILNNRWNVIFGRTLHQGQTIIPTGQQTLALGDLTNLISSQAELEKVSQILGDLAPEHLEQDLSVYDKRRFFVSNPQAAGHCLRDLDLLERFGAIVTRIRRGDVELLPHGNTVLNMGDQVRVVARYDAMDRLATLFGDSYRAVSEIDMLTFSLGIGLGVLLGLVPIPLPGGITFSLGAAGGPLIVSLILGAIGRTGPLNWTMPYSANLTIRQIGLVLFLAAVGTRSGYAFITTLASGSGVELLFSGLVITVMVALASLWIGYRLLKIPMTVMLGILSGMQTQTAVLSFATEQTKNEIPNIDYATIYPIATIAKILLAQVLVAFLK